MLFCLPAWGGKAEAEIVFADAAPNWAARLIAGAQCECVVPVLLRALHREHRRAFAVHGQVDHGDSLFERRVTQRRRQANVGHDGLVNVQVATKGEQARGRTAVRRRDGLEAESGVLGHGAGEGVEGDGVHIAVPVSAVTAAMPASSKADGRGLMPLEVMAKESWLVGC